MPEAYAYLRQLIRFGYLADDEPFSVTIDDDTHGHIGTCPLGTAAPVHRSMADLRTREPVLTWCACLTENRRTHWQNRLDPTTHEQLIWNLRVAAQTEISLRTLPWCNTERGFLPPDGPDGFVNAAVAETVANLDEGIAYVRGLADYETTLHGHYSAGLRILETADQDPDLWVDGERYPGEDLPATLWDQRIPHAARHAEARVCHAWAVLDAPRLRRNSVGMTYDREVHGATRVGHDLLVRLPAVLLVAAKIADADVLGIDNDYQTDDVLAVLDLVRNGTDLSDAVTALTAARA